MVNVSKGYYYLGAKAIKPNSSYIIRFSSYSQDQRLILSEMNMSNTNLKWYGKNENLIITLDSLKCQNKCNVTKFIRYYLYVGKNIDSINKRTRCGIQDANQSVKVYEVIQTDLTSPNVSFKVPLSAVPSQFALSVRA